MKKNSYLSILLILCSFGLCSSCSNDDIKTEVSKQSSLAEQLNKSKLATIGHNIMLENFYNLLKKNPISVNKNVLNSEKALDSCINLFIIANKSFNLDNKTNTRVSNEDFPTSSFLKECIVDNYAFKDKTRGISENGEKIPAYLIKFYDDFFNSKTLDIDNLDNEILVVIEQVKSSFPNLTKEELDGLFFVAGITYNSCIYWHNNSNKWMSMLTDRKDTRAHWLWEGVKNGVKKWAKADGGGALKVWTVNKIAGLSSGGTALLAGAAVGSAVGAWNNLPVWD